MNATHDWLDEAIDHVATRLTKVTKDDALASRILASLPERAPMPWWAPRLAIPSVLAIGALFVVLRPFDDRSTGVLRTENSSAPFVEFRAAFERTTVEPALIVRRTIVGPPSNDRRTIDAPDHEYSLRAIDAPDALSVSVLAPESLAVADALSLAPLTITELSLTEEQ